MHKDCVTRDTYCYHDVVQAADPALVTGIQPTHNYETGNGKLADAADLCDSQLSTAGFPTAASHGA